jgi:cytochrome c-type biogenesis protein CcmF
VLKKAGGAIAHVGFAMMLTGILISSSKKEVISHNTTGIFLNFGEGSKEKPGENLTLIKGVPTKMGEFTVTYDKDSAHPKKPLWFYHLKFEKDGKESFTLAPNAFVNYKGNEGLMANPDAKHYLTHDIFTYITSLPDPSKANEDTTSFKSREVVIGDTVFYSKGFAVLEDVSSIKNIPGVEFGANDSASVATIKVISKTSSIFTVKPTVINLKGTVFAQPDTVLQESLVMQLQKVDGKKITLGLKESDAIMQYVTLKAYKFPFINLLWLGTVLMVLGFMISMAWRIQNNRKKPSGKEKGVKMAGVQEQAFEV